MGFFEIFIGVGMNFPVYTLISTLLLMVAWVFTMIYLTETRGIRGTKKREIFWALKYGELLIVIYLVEGVYRAGQNLLISSPFSDISSFKAYAFGAFLFAMSWAFVMLTISLCILLVLMAIAVTKNGVIKNFIKRTFNSIMRGPRAYIQWNKNIAGAIEEMGWIGFWKEPFLSYSVWLVMERDRKREKNMAGIHKAEKEYAEATKERQLELWYPLDNDKE